MTPNEDIIQDVIAYLQGKASDQQIEKLHVWLAKDENNKATYRNIAETYYSVNNIQNWDEVNVFAAKRKVEANIVKKRRFPYWSVAASIILLFGISITLFLTDFPEEQKLAETIQIEPGKKGAELILSNGKSVQVMNAQKLLTEEDGSLVQVDSLNGVVYENQNTGSDKLIYNTIKVARGQEFNLQLADGTRVWLNAESELRYPVKFVAKNRKVYLKGEAYFEVTHNKEKAFVVNSFNQDVRVYGTKFNINAYDKNLIKTVLLEGSVGVKIVRNEEEKKIIPGDLLVANMIDASMETKQVNVYPYVAWKDGNFLFQDENLEEIMIRLERWYNVKVFFEDDDAREILFVGDLKRYTKIDRLLYFMEKSSNASFEIKGDVIVVRSN